MSEQVRNYIDNYPSGIVDLFDALRQALMESISSEIKEVLWAKIPSYYVGESFVRLLPFKDHINIEAQAITQHLEELSYYKITPKGMLQIYLQQEIPWEVLKQIFVETFC